MATPEKIAQYRNAQGFTGLVVKDNADASDGVLLGGHIVHAGMITPPTASTAALGSTTADAAVLPAAAGSFYPTTGANGTVGVRINGADKIDGKMLFIRCGAEGLSPDRRHDQRRRSRCGLFLGVGPRRAPHLPVGLGQYLGRVLSNER